MFRPLLLALPLVLLAVGCRKPAPPLAVVAPPSVAGTGWTEARDLQSGVSLDLPPGWRVGVPRAFDASALMGDATNPNPTDPNLMRMAAGMEKEDAEAERKTLAKLREKDGIILHCVDGSKPTLAEEPTRIYVKKFPDAGWTTLDEAATAEKQEGHREAKVTIVDLPVGKAARLLAQGQNRIGDQECHVSYVFLDGKDAYALRFASTNAPDAILGIEKDVARTFRVSKSH